MRLGQSTQKGEAKEKRRKINNMGDNGNKLICQPEKQALDEDNPIRPSAKAVAGIKAFFHFI